MDTILLIGSEGSIGRRYGSILNSLGHTWVGFDPTLHAFPPTPDRFDRAIIAAPTNRHWELCLAMIGMRKPFLCEKPLCSTSGLAKLVQKSAYETHVQGFVVNNLLLLAHKMDFRPGDHIKYNFYNTGRDGTLMDCCQLLYLDPEAEIRTTSPIWSLTIGSSRVPYRLLEESYVHMIKAFCDQNYSVLAPLSVGIEMIEAVERLQK